MTFSKWRLAIIMTFRLPFFWLTLYVLALINIIGTFSH